MKHKNIRAIYSNREENINAESDSYRIHEADKKQEGAYT